MRITNNPILCRDYSYQNPRKNIAKPADNLSVQTNSTPITFQGMYADKMKNIFHNPLRSFNDFSISEYSQLSPSQLKSLRGRYKHLSSSSYGGFFRNAEIIHDKASEAIKTSLDSQYGKDNYRVVTIGRSLSSIGKVLGYKIGEENVINIPMSHCARFTDPFDISYVKNTGEAAIFLNYLKGVGIDKESLDKSGKKLILMDYCYTGESLKGADKLFRSVFGESDNIVSVNVLDLIDNPKLRSPLSQILLSSTYKRLSFVDQATDLMNLKMHEANTSKAEYETRLLWFKLLDNHMTNKQHDLEDIKHDNWNLLALGF
ncbi:MAG: hypothetical protein K6E29_07825 [Cyanobacteria bacterium RUI128]|nr:hypothetical protein [Cyanobacteria bacterium RUI128]